MLSCASTDLYVWLSVTDNAAFSYALQRRLEKLDQAERHALEKAYQDISPEDLLSKVSQFDKAHNEKSTCRRCAKPVARFLRVIEQFMQGVAIGLQCSPEISSLVVGAIRILIDVWTLFAR